MCRLQLYSLTHSLSLSHIFICLCMRIQTHTHTLPWNLDKGAKLCKLGPLSQQVDEDNWIRCVWSLGPRDQSSGTSGQTYTHTHRRKWEHHVKPQKLQLGWLKKPDIHTPARPPGAEPVGLGLSLGRPQESSLTLGHKHPSAPAHPPPQPNTTWRQDQEHSGCVRDTWGVHTTINGWLLQLQGQCYYHTYQEKE